MSNEKRIGMEIKKEICFVITPIGNEHEPIRRHIDGIIEAAITPVLEDEYEVLAAHKISETGSINQQVIKLIDESKIVIANLTNLNPNVMYELAIRHCMGKPVIQIMEKGTILPFDIGTERTIVYVNDAKGILELRQRLEEFIEEIEFEKPKQGPIFQVLQNLDIENKLKTQVDNASQNDVSIAVLLELVNKVNDLSDKVNSLLKTPEVYYRKESESEFIKRINKFSDYQKIEASQLNFENEKSLKRREICLKTNENR